jgi:hypothetical protein
VEASPVSEADVHVGSGVIQAAAGCGREAGGQTSDSRFVAGTEGDAFEAGAAVDVDLVWAVHEDVGDSWLREEPVEWTGAEGLTPEGSDDSQHGGVAEHRAIHSKCGGDPRWGRLGSLCSKGSADSLEEIGRDIRAAIEPLHAAINP